MHVADEAGKRLGKARLPEGVDGVARFHELVGVLVEDPAEVVIGVETDRGLFVTALVAAGYQLYAVNPMSTSRYRERHSTSGAKSDAGDAQVLSDMVRTDRHRHRLMAGDSEQVEAVKVLARAHQMWSRGRQTNLVRSTLREFYPAALVAFDDLASGDALEVLRVAPTPTLGAGLSRSKIAAALRRGGRQRRVEERTVQIQTALRPEQLQAPVAVAAAMGTSVAASVAVIADEHPRTTPARHPSPGASGTKKIVLARHVRNRRLGDAIYLWAFASLTASAGARAYYDQRRTSGDGHHQALRALGNRLVGILHGCLTHHALYDETIAWAHRTDNKLASAA